MQINHETEGEDKTIKMLVGSGILVAADTVRGLCSGKGFLFADREEFVSKGFEEPVRVFEVSWRG